MPLAGLETATFFAPADQVGGDFYDWLVLSNERAGLLIADVTGHAFHCALQVAMTKSALHVGARDENDPAQIIATLRHTLDLAPERKLLMSCCYVLFEPRYARLQFANAGHPPPLVWRAHERSTYRLDAIDPLLGALSRDEATFASRFGPWTRGDLLVAYTDGVTDARNARGEPFGIERLPTCVRAHGGAAVEVLIASIRDALSAHTAATLSKMTVCRSSLSCLDTSFATTLMVELAPRSPAPAASRRYLRCRPVMATGAVKNLQPFSDRDATTTYPDETRARSTSTPAWKQRQRRARRALSPCHRWHRTGCASHAPRAYLRSRQRVHAMRARAAATPLPGRGARCRSLMRERRARLMYRPAP